MATNAPGSAPKRPKRPRSRAGDTDVAGPQLAVLRLLEREPVLARRHVEALAFPAGTPLSRARRCQLVLRALTERGLLYRERPPRRLPGGSEQAIYMLAPRGQRLLARLDGRSLGRPRRPEERGQASRAHLLAVADLQVALQAAARRHRRVLRWVGEPECWWQFRSPAGAELLKPDAYVEVAHEREARIAWIELDRGTQSVPHTIAAKARRYCRAAKARAAAGEPVPLVAVVGETAERRERIARRIPGWGAQEGLAREVSLALVASLDPEALIARLVGGR